MQRLYAYKRVGDITIVLIYSVKFSNILIWIELRFFLLGLFFSIINVNKEIVEKQKPNVKKNMNGEIKYKKGIQKVKSMPAKVQ